MEQLTESGLYTGGTIPYGYRVEHRGRINKRNREVGDLVVDEDTAKIVQLIFYKYVHEGYGAQRLCRYLNDLGIRKANGKNFPNTSINRIIKTRIYTGVIHNGDAKSEVIEELRIIDQDTFDKAQQLMSERTTHHKETPLNLRGSSLMVGNIYCGHCRYRLTLTTSGRKHLNPDGSIRYETRSRYQCHYNLRHPGECDGQSGYGVKKVDEMMDQIIRLQFERIRAASANEIVAEQNEKAISLAKARYKAATVQLNDKAKELADFENETIKVIRGESQLNADLLNKLIERVKAEITELQGAVEAAKTDLELCMQSTEAEQAEFDKLKNWAYLYDTCSFEAKKMIACQFVKAVYVHRNYDLEVEFNVSFDDFKLLEGQGAALAAGEVGDTAEVAT